LHIEQLLERRPFALSGGQQQRVAIARALVKSPSLLLLDEPFANLDSALSQELLDEFRALQKREGITSVYVTHSKEEALTVSDEIVVLNSGLIEQQSPPQVVYLNPHNQFVAEFFTTAATNTIRGNIYDGTFVSIDESIRIAVPGCTNERRKDLVLLLRPEHIKLSTENKTSRFPARIESIRFQGDRAIVMLSVGNMILSAYTEYPCYSEGEFLTAFIVVEDLLLFEERSGLRI